MALNPNKLFTTSTDQPRSTSSRADQHRRSPQRSPSLSFNQLEDRRLLAALITHDTGTSLITIYGTKADDAAYVNYLNGSQVSISITGGATETFSTDDVRKIKFYGSAGDDLFENNTAIDSHFGGHGGEDTFRGGAGSDTVYGGDGIDNIFGNGGDDLLSGGGDADNIHGGDGNDVLHGNHGNDNLFGDAGNDALWGEWDNDIMRGGAGNDRFYGFSGDDVIYGDAGDDLAYGQHGDDTFYGGAGNDRLRGNPGNDKIYGEDGADYLLGDGGNDTLSGGDGADDIVGYDGDDIIDGGDGNDGLYAGRGNDQVDGGGGDDEIIGDFGDDTLRGGAGNDHIYGQGGNDLIYGGAGSDYLAGNDGDDSLFGGQLSAVDTLVGNEGSDRFLVHANDDASNTLLDTIRGRTAADAVLLFINRDSAWSDREIEVLDGAFSKLYQTTGNLSLLKDPLPTGDLKFFKYAKDSLNGFAGINNLRTTSRTITNRNGSQTTSHTYSREIRIADWNENSSFYNDSFQSIVLHEIGHNWDGETELTAASASLSNLWDRWLAQSAWTKSGSSWNHSASAVFASDYGGTNPYEDFSTTWELYYSGDSVTDSKLQAKLALLDELFGALSTD